MTRHSETHLDSDRLQGLAERALDAAERQAAERHLERCARCRAEFEAWELLFNELEALPSLGPSARFSEEVMARIDSGPQPNWFPARGAEPAVDSGSFASGVLGWIRERLPVAARSGSDTHLSDEGFQGYVEGLLGRSTRARVETHLGACHTCRTQLKGWETVFTELGDLPRLAPSPGFAEQVMARTSVESIARAAAPAPAPGRKLLAAARRFLPSTPKGWTVAGGIVAAPSVGLIAAVATVVFHPLLSMRDLGLFLAWQASEWAAATWNGAVGLLVGTPWVAQLAQALTGLADTPGLAVTGLAALWAGTLVSGFVLYRYLIAPTLTAGHHAKAS